MSESVGKETTEPDDLNVGLIATIAIVGALLVMAIAAALTALVRSESSAYGVEVGAYSDLGTVARLKKEQRAKLAAPAAWVDQAKGKVSMPIDHAMELVTTDIQRDPSLATVVPAGVASAAPSTAPSGSAEVPPPAPEAAPVSPAQKHHVLTGEAKLRPAPIPVAPTGK